MNIAMVPRKKKKEKKKRTAGINLCSIAPPLAGFDSQDEIVLTYLQLGLENKENPSVTCFIWHCRVTTLSLNWCRSLEKIFNLFYPSVY